MAARREQRIHILRFCAQRTQHAPVAVVAHRDIGGVAVVRGRRTVAYLRQVTGAVVAVPLSV